MKISVKDLTIDGVYTFIKELGEQKYRAEQLLSWIYKKNCESFNEMTNISKSFRQKLEETAELHLFKNFTSFQSKDKSEKYRLTLKDDEVIETVFIPEMKKSTLCLSSQVGCKFACKICKTGQMGYKRNLTSGEIIEQILVVRRNHSISPRISNLVFMGMGEPLDNFENLIKALTVITHEKGLDFSPRYITVSTLGYIPNLMKLGELFPNLSLAVSLNAVDNETRNSIIPLNKKYPIEKLVETLKRYPMKPRKLVTIEYVLIQELNDSPDDAQKLIRLLRGVKCKINLIPYNEFEPSPYISPSWKRIEDFRMILINAGFTCITRKSRGLDINAACGCLASNNMIPD